jgi:hypothetical protein
MCKYFCIIGRVEKWCVLCVNIFSWVCVRERSLVCWKTEPLRKITLVFLVDVILVNVMGLKLRWSVTEWQNWLMVEFSCFPSWCFRSIQFFFSFYVDLPLIWKKLMWLKSILNKKLTLAIKEPMKLRTIKSELPESSTISWTMYPLSTNHWLC